MPYSMVRDINIFRSILYLYGSYSLNKLGDAKVAVSRWNPAQPTPVIPFLGVG